MLNIRGVMNAPIRLVRRLANHPIATGITTLAADQITKFSISRETSSCLIDRLVCLDYFHNKLGTQGQTPLTNLEFGLTLTTLSALFLGVKSRLTQLGLALIVGGNSGNFIDRLLTGGAHDFIKLGGWDTFNIGDAAGVAGLALIGIEALTGPTEEYLQSLETVPSRLSIVKNSLTRNLLNTAGQVLLFSLTFWAVTSVYFKPAAMFIPLAFSLIRDMRHKGERMF